ncbi:MAG: aminotransferase class III-fold pyridoxal phosphate-dependent enzyme [Rikenellaceae bacterium]
MKTLRSQFLQNIAQTSPEPMLIEVEKAQGIFLYDSTGKKYLDLISGVSVSNVGHANPKVIEAVQKQAADYMHTMVYGETLQRIQIDYATQIAKAMGDMDQSIYFVNSGAEAIEVAMKLAKRVTSRTQIISMRNAYHGSTHGALSIQGDEYFKNAFRPLLPDCHLVNFNNIEDLKKITHQTAAVVTEVVQGESGVNPANQQWLEMLRERCTQTGTMLIFDEIQTGFGRSGKIFAYQNYGVAPDMLCLAKALGGGLPLGAVVAKKKVMDNFTSNPVLGHINTFGGNPVCCAAGLAALQYIQEHDLCTNAVERGEQFYQLLKGHTAVDEIRRSGLLLAVELGSSQRMFRMIELLKEAGYMSDWFLFCDTAFRISPPLTITSDEVESCCSEILGLLDLL